jgi:hypothetical protein
VSYGFGIPNSHVSQRRRDMGHPQAFIVGAKSCRASLDWTADGGCPYIEPYQACFIALANLSGGSVFSTSSLVSHARLACRTP